MSSLAVKITEEWGTPLIELTDQNAQRFFYLRKPDGSLELGQPWMLIHGDYTVKIFRSLEPGGLVEVLDVVVR
jgi:hypothetical protein